VEIESPLPSISYDAGLTMEYSIRENVFLAIPNLRKHLSVVRHEESKDFGIFARLGGDCDKIGEDLRLRRRLHV
jgi:hypothetical protein